MFCNKCGKKMNDGDIFCTGCGNRVVINVEQKETLEETVREKEINIEVKKPVVEPEKETVTENQVTAPEKDMIVEKMVAEEEKKSPIELTINEEAIKETLEPYVTKIEQGAKDAKLKIQKANLKKIGIVAGVAVVFVLLVVLVANRDYKLDIAKYTTVKFEGCNGYGSVRVDINDDAIELLFLKNAKLEDEYSKALKKIDTKDMDKALDEYDDWMDEMDFAEAWEFEEYRDIMYDLYDYDVEMKDNLSNGDEISVVFEVDNELAKEYGIKLVADTIVCKVEGLPEAKEIDVFENIEVSFTGTSPFVEASLLDNNTELNSYVTYSIDKEENIKVGDKVVVTAEVDEESMLEGMHCYPKETTKEFVCENVPYYVNKLEQIPSDMMDKMKLQLEDHLKAYVANNWSNPKDLKKMQFLGNYLLVGKDGTNVTSRLFVVYKVNVKTSDDKLSYYYYGYFDNIIILEDGTCSVDISAMVTPQGNYGLFTGLTGETFERENGDWYIGYESLDSLFNHCVTKNIDSCTYESTVEQ